MKAMKAISTGEYGEVISRYFQQNFPKVIKISKDNLLEVLTDLIVGTKEYRYGPKPKIESLFTIRQTLSKAIELGAPIPVLVPWGGRKMDPSLSLDVAEVSALRQLIAVDEAIKQFYEPGLHVHMRIEDVNAEWLYKTEKGVEEYSSGMVRLVELLKGSTHIEPLRESILMDKNQYMRTAEEFGYLLDDVLTALVAMPSLEVETIPAYNKLVEKGWKGTIPREQRDYYLQRYEKLYKNSSEAQRINMLADYFAGSFARYKLDGRGEPSSAVGSFLQINFSHPVPGAPTSIFSNTVYYRTVPYSAGRTHGAPWRVKGYLEIVDDTPVPKVLHSANEIRDMQFNEVEIFDEVNEDPLIIRADYTLETVMMPPFFA